MFFTANILFITAFVFVSGKVDELVKEKLSGELQEKNFTHAEDANEAIIVDPLPETLSLNDTMNATRTRRMHKGRCYVDIRIRVRRNGHCKRNRDHQNYIYCHPIRPLPPNVVAERPQKFCLDESSIGGRCRFYYNGFRKTEGECEELKRGFGCRIKRRVYRPYATRHDVHVNGCFYTKPAWDERDF